METIKMTSGIGKIVKMLSFCHCEKVRSADEAILKDCFGLCPALSLERAGLRPRNDNQEAFTLVEMLVVLAIVAMIMAISVPFTSGFGKGLRIKTATRAITGIIKVARSNSITFRKKYSVVFDVKKSQYWIEDEAGHIYEKKYLLPSSIKFEIKGYGEGDPITFENDRIVFNSSGVIEGVDGSVTFTDKQGGSRVISVVGATGKITIN